MQRDDSRNERDDRGWWIAIGVFLLVVLVVPVLGGGMMGPGMMGGYPGSGMPLSGNGWLWGLGTGLGWLMMLAVWGVIVAGAVLLLRFVAPRTGSRPTPSESPLEFLKQRYAAGEITREQYESMREVLQK
jgi:putative membrane protein